MLRMVIQWLELFWLILNARLSILVPLARGHHAVIIPGSAPHNHPIHMQTKAPFNAWKWYSACVVASGSGVVRMTPSRIDDRKVYIIAVSTEININLSL